MSTLRTLKKLPFGETWLLPTGLAALVIVALIVRWLDRHVWTDVGGFVLLVGVVSVLLTSVARTARH
jgi:hypothetical protein